jgi:glycosyltransferase involved in cell wall biosynthesis
LDRLVKAVVVQDGARMHYGLPLALARANCLERMFTDFYAAPGSLASECVRLISKFRPSLGRRMALRFCEDLPQEFVCHNPVLAFGQQAARIGVQFTEDFYLRCSDLMGKWIRRVGLGEANALVGFVRNIDPRLCRYAQRRGLKVICDQIIAPAYIENREHRLQTERWPGWEPERPDPPVRTLEQQTWSASDHLTAPSEYVKDGLVEEGIDPSRVTVLPYPVAPNWFQPVDQPKRNKQFTVGFTGAVSLRKGAPYFLETARRLAGSNFRFIMIGPVELNLDAAQQNRGAVEFLGPKSRRQVAELLGEIDVFYFPSTCEGSAGSVMEAMTAGLPVVCSPNTGSLVRDGQDGYIVRYDDTERAAERLTELARDPELRREMGQSARKRAVTFDVEFYSHAWSALLKRVLNINAKCDSIC